MKLSASALKSLDYKQLLINHGEKLGIAIVGLLVAYALMGTNWKGTDKSPTAMKDEADKAIETIKSLPWPEGERQALGGDSDLPKKVELLLSPVGGSYAVRGFYPPLHPEKKLISKPRWLAVKHLIADPQVADLLMGPNVEELSEGFLRKAVKEKEPKDRVARRREKEKKKAEAELKKEREKAGPSAEPVSDEFKTAKGGGGNGRMGLGVSLMREGRGRMRGSDRRRDKGRGGDMDLNEEAPETPAPTKPDKPVGRGYRFVAVRGIFPLSEQLSELQDAMGEPRDSHKNQDLIQFRDFQLERQTLVQRSTGWEPASEWAPVDRQPVIDLLQNDIAGYAPETVMDGLVDTHICMPYPERVYGDWGKLATHPDIQDFVLSDEEVDAQVQYERKVIERYREEEQKKKGPADKSPFAGLSKNVRTMARAPGQQVGENTLTIQELIVKELEEGKTKKELIDAQLEAYVRRRASAVNHLLLFRYLDFTVKPGETYRYRVKLLVANPFRERRTEEVADPSIIDGDERPTEYSEPTSPVSVPGDARFFVKRIDSRVGRPSLPAAEMDIFQWFRSTGTVANGRFATQIGQLLGGTRANTDVVRPAEETFDKETVPFSTTDALVDVASGFNLDQTLHKDIFDAVAASSGKRGSGSPPAPDEAIIVDENGDLQLIDGFDQKGDYDKVKGRYEQQNRAFEQYRQSDDNDDRGPRKGGLFGGRGMGMSRKPGRNDPRRQFRHGRDKGG